MPRRTTTCPTCERTWTGDTTCHCGQCHRTFTGIRAFDRHLEGIEPVECRNPNEDDGLVYDPDARSGGAWKHAGGLRDPSRYLDTAPTPNVSTEAHSTPGAST